MRVELTSHFEIVRRNAERCGAHSMSVQNYWTFVNFKERAAAVAFATWAVKENLTTNGLNTERPFVPYEVAVRHPV